MSKKKSIISGILLGVLIFVVLEALHYFFCKIIPTKTIPEMMGALSAFLYFFVYLPILLCPIIFKLKSSSNFPLHFTASAFATVSTIIIIHFCVCCIKYKLTNFDHGMHSMLLTFYTGVFAADIAHTTYLKIKGKKMQDTVQRYDEAFRKKNIDILVCIALFASVFAIIHSTSDMLYIENKNLLVISSRFILYFCIYSYFAIKASSMHPWKSFLISLSINTLGFILSPYFAINDDSTSFYRTTIVVILLTDLIFSIVIYSKQMRLKKLGCAK